MDAAHLFDHPADVVARRLIGATLLFHDVGGRVVETEAYDATDPASHSFRGPTKRNAPMFGPPGRAYVYRIYGLHWCFNVVCDASSAGSAVLIRALEPSHGVEGMRQRRGAAPFPALCAGPGRLCQALGIGEAVNGARIGPFPLEIKSADAPVDVVQGVRVGVRHAADVRRRFGLAGSPFLSRPFPPVPGSQVAVICA